MIDDSSTMHRVEEGGSISLSLSLSLAHVLSLSEYYDNMAGEVRVVTSWREKVTDRRQYPE
jgi:hypothetical protein